MKLFQLLKPWWQSEEKFVAWGGLTVAICLNLSVVYINIVFNEWNRDFYDSIQKLDQGLFVESLWKFSWILALMVTLYSGSAFFARWYSLRWRKWMTNYLIDNWMERQNFYRVMLLKHSPDNPDQRISDDINNFTNTTVTLGLEFFQNIVNAVAFVGILAGLSGPLVFQLLGIDFNIPAYLVWVALIYAFVATYTAVIVGRPLIKLDFEQEKFEANFRYHLVRIRERREEIAFYHGGDQEHEGLRSRFSAIWDNILRILRRKIFLNVTQNVFASSASLIPIIAASPALFSGKISFGILMQITSSFGMLQNSLAVISTGFSQIAQWLANSRRLRQFATRLDDLDKSHSGFHYQKDDCLSFQNVVILTLDGKVISGPLNFDVKPGQRVLIAGPSGAGKTSLMRVMAKLWSSGTGTVILPKEEIFFSPQRCYLPLGTLKMALSYPFRKEFSNDDLVRAMQLVHLEHLAPFLDVEDDWMLRLSQGEQQRVSIARILLYRPKWLIMDEPTAALDESTATSIFKNLTLALPSTTIMTISHNQFLKSFHTSSILIEPINR